ncbi:MAG: hypothetical protein Tsb009_19200 [Planctomycetaceae bacterium]
MDVTGISYLNETEELREVVEQMRVPLAFKHGPREAELAYLKEKLRREKMMRETDFRLPDKSDPKLWAFRESKTTSRFAEYHFAGKWRSIGITQWKVLRVLATNRGPTTFEQVANVIYEGREKPREFARVSGMVCKVISSLRRTLCAEFNLTHQWNPVPCVERGNGGKWTLLLPRVFLEDSAGGAG